jgi:glycosyltransferase involved in cell wall biosynthesis
MNKKVSCIIPAYNEGPRIKKVLSSVQNHPLINEVIVVNDGSTDNTQKIIGRFKGIKIVSYEKNRGKSYAVMRGIQSSKNNIILLLDADLKNIRKKDISDLLNPVLKNKVDVTISMRSNDFLIFKILGIDSLSGERVFPKKLIKDYRKLEFIPSFGLEVFINERICKEKYSIKVINWSRTENTRKYNKMG